MSKVHRPWIIWARRLFRRYGLYSAIAVALSLLVMLLGYEFMSLAVHLRGHR